MAKVLIVDDISANIRLLEAKLTKNYYQVFSALSGKEAIEKAKEVRPDIILLDVMMPEMDGFETCALLKKMPETEETPIVMVTALSDIENKIHGLEAGADDFITKPINDLALFARIRSLVRMKSMLDELRMRDLTGVDLGILKDDVSRQEITDISGARVLCIYNERYEINELADRMKEKGISVELADDPVKAYDICQRYEFDLVIVSEGIDNNNGILFCSHLKGIHNLRRTPIIILIDDSDTEVVVKALDMGVNDYLHLPIDANEGIARVTTQVRRKRLQDALKASNQQDLSMIYKDPLTDVYNRYYFDSYLSKMLKIFAEEGRPLALALIDLDFFKKVNDTYGHLAGDAVLKQMSELFSDMLRSTDLIARYGGEEFAIVLPNTLITHAAEVGKRIKVAVEKHKFIIPGNSNPINCTVSIGIARAIEGDDSMKLIAKADKALYHVKNNGRNKVVVYNG